MDLAIGSDFMNDAETDHHEQQSENNAGRKREDEEQGTQPERQRRGRRAEIAGAALGADLGIARIEMPRRAELGVIG